jgi:hypothetical protein
MILLLLFSCSGERTEDSSNAHTWIKTTIGYYLNKEANDLTEEVIRETFDTWSEKTHFTFVYKGRHRAGLHRDGKNTVSFLVRWPKNIPFNKVGYCLQWYDKAGHIIESDIIFNMRLTRFTTRKTNTPHAYYIEGVLSHEIGHMIGLGHIESDSSIMKYKSDAEESFFKGEIDDETLAAYKKLYSLVP